MRRSDPAGRRGAVALGLTGLSVGLVGLTALLGPSVAVPALGAGPRGVPPIHAHADPDPWLVIAVLAIGYVAGAAGLVLGLRALRMGWRPDPRRLLAAGAVAVAALAVVPPVGSADALSYAAYGRIALAGDDPYVVPPAPWRSGTDPITSAVERPWQLAPSVYGPLVTAEQALASALGGDSPAATVAWLSVVNGLAFLLAGVLLVRLAGADPARRARAALLWTVNPLLLTTVVAGAHVDAYAVAWGVAGLAALRRSPLLAGALVAAAVASKASLALLGLAVAWALRDRWGDLARCAAGAALVLIPAYVLAGPHVHDQVGQASRFVSLASPWQLIVDGLDAAFGTGLSRLLIRLGAVAALVLVAVALHRLLPRATADRGSAAGSAPSAGLPPVLDTTDPAPTAHTAARAFVVLTGAWLLTAPYSLPWYDAALWAALALLPPSRVDVVAVARTTVLGLAYVPGRAEVPASVAEPTLAWRGGVTPWLALGLVLLVLVWARRPRHPAPAPPPAHPVPAR